LFGGFGIGSSPGDFPSSLAVIPALRHSRLPFVSLAKARIQASRTVRLRLISRLGENAGEWGG
jgi:hypothetical protein